MSSEGMATLTQRAEWPYGIDVDTSTAEILLAATNHDVDTLRRLLQKTSVHVRDEDAGTTPLHAALLGCEADEDTHSGVDVEVTTAIPVDSSQEETAVTTMRCLFENGATWNELDAAGETPGCTALRLGLKRAYGVIVDEGVKAVSLLNRLDGFERIDDDEIVDDGDGTSDGRSNPETTSSQSGNDDLILATVTSARPLASELGIGLDRLPIRDTSGRTMSWQTDIMQQSVDHLIIRPGPRVLNIGLGTGIIDDIFQEQRPSVHHIIHARPEALDRIEKHRWSAIPGVQIYEGLWEDCIQELVDQGLTYDAIYFDTTGETYSGLRAFFSAYATTLLDPNGRFSFLHVLGADRQVNYDVYTRIVEMDLLDANLDTQWFEVPIEGLDAAAESKAARRDRWTLPLYRLPICTFTR
ncbi:Protein arginine N-methyltransferase 2 [Sphaceloma murrayae]|uniref:Arginine N-methyltransferase 2 n=1 Tax=Sphaceloma murrayae TaxID=2082308 RepID=A0A2K1R005_9PEZI|nr:Protein arginine N-methyltransferase 2 [Sphaceloma murrayae]